MGDEARSDVALTIAALVFGPLLLRGLRGGTGTVGVLTDLAVVLALTALVPLLLIRARAGSSGASSAVGVLALDRSPQGVATGLALALPVALAGAFGMVTDDATPGAALLGNLSGAPIEVLDVLAVSIGAFVFIVFIVRRGSEGFARSPEWPLRRLLRTLGMGGAAVALVAGLLRVPLGAQPLRVVANAAALAVLVLVADQLLGPRTTVPRLALLLPAALTFYLHLTAFGLGVGLQAGALAAGTTVVIGTLALSASGGWPVIPLIIAVHLWPTCLTPLVFGKGLC